MRTNRTLENVHKDPRLLTSKYESKTKSAEGETREERTWIRIFANQLFACNAVP